MRDTGRHGMGKEKGKRLYLLDGLRGVSLCSMIAYHGIWDLVYILGKEIPWYHGKAAFFWQQSICWTFILLSGLCSVLAGHKLRRGLEITAAGAVITAVTLFFFPAERVIFGVLTMLGASMLLVGALEKRIWKRLPAFPMMAVSLILFYVFYPVNRGVLQWGAGKVSLPAEWYRGAGMTFLGFPAPGFYSADYFSLFPWFFLYMAGYFGGRLLQEKGILKNSLFQIRLPLLSWMGRYSLWVYLLHQPILYGIILAAGR